MAVCVAVVSKEVRESAVVCLVLFCASRLRLCAHANHENGQGIAQPTSDATVARNAPVLH